MRPGTNPTYSASRVGIHCTPFETRENRKRYGCARCGIGVEKPRKDKARYCRDCRMVDPEFVAANP